MAEKRKIIIDTDPGIDDVLGMLLACSDKPEALEIMLISVTFGNVQVLDCLRNVMTLFHTINKEKQWRRQNGLPEGFTTLDACKPIVAVGASQPLQDQLMLADYFHGRDGLADTHTSHPQFDPSDPWMQHFGLASGTPQPQVISEVTNSTPNDSSLFVPSTQPAHKEILRLLRENPKDTITIIAIGPLTNLSLAAAEDPETFLRVKEVVVMGGAIDMPGNFSPLAEFNIHADAVAAARVFALTSPNPRTTMPPPPPPGSTINGVTPSKLPAYPENLSRTLNLTLLPLDVTNIHLLIESRFNSLAKPLIEAGSPVAAWMDAFISSTFTQLGRARGSTKEGKPARAPSLSMHDPLALYYAMRPASSEARWTFRRNVDVRVETAGQWARGACITDRRGSKRRPAAADADVDAHVAGDAGGWKSERRGNRVTIISGSSYSDDGKSDAESGVFGHLLCKGIFGQDTGKFL